MFIIVLGVGIFAVHRSSIFGKEAWHKAFLTLPFTLAMTGVDVSRGRSAVVPGREAWWSTLAPIVPGPAPRGAERLLGFEWARRILPSGWEGRHLSPTAQGLLGGKAAPDRGTSSPSSLLQGSALMHFYLLEEARPPGCGTSGARRSTRTAPAGLLGQRRLRGAIPGTERARQRC